MLAKSVSFKWVFLLVVVVSGTLIAETSFCQEPSQQAYHNHAFSLKLFGLVDSEEKNTLVTPHAVGSTLYLLALGSQASTKNQILDSLGFNASNVKARDSYSFYYDYESLQELKAYTALGAQRLSDFEPEFVQKVNGSPVASFISATLDSIHKWASEVSNGKMNTIVPILAPGTEFLALSLSDFNVSFSPEDFTDLELIEGLFNIKEDQVVKVQYVKVVVPLREISTDQFQAFLWEHPKYDIFILCPRGYDNLPSLVKRMDGHFFRSKVDQLRVFPSKLHSLQLPVFTNMQARSLILPLQGMGVFDVFNSTEAEFSLSHNVITQLDDFLSASIFSISLPQGFKIKGPREKFEEGDDKVFHPLELKLNRPFVLIVADRDTKNILCISKVLNPKI